MEDRIEKRIDLKAPVSRVWRALTDHREFGTWFRGALEGPFIPGQQEPERLFSFTWHPYAIDPNADYSSEHPTLVEFKLESTPTGTLLIVTESGFAALPAHRRDEAFRMNSQGWSIQIENISQHVGQTP